MSLPSLQTGTRLTTHDTDDHILDIERGIKFLNPRDNGIRFVKRLISNRGNKVARSFKHEWVETALPVRKETVSLAADNTTTLTVANAYGYQVGDILLIGSEYVRVTALASSTTLTITRGFGGSTAAIHSSVPAYNLGAAAAEGADPPVGMTLNSDKLYNYVQTFDRGVTMSNDEIAQLSAELGNPFNAQLERVTLYFWKLFAQAAFYGKRYEDTSGDAPIRTMGGVNQFLSSNVDAVDGALTVAAIDDQIETIVNNGGNPDVLVMGTAQKRNLDLLDSEAVRIDKGETRGGGLNTQTWRSGILDSSLDIIVDHSIKSDELYILDSSDISLVPLSNNGINGKLSIADATTPGADRKSKVLRAKYTLQFGREAGMAKLTGLTV